MPEFLEVKPESPAAVALSVTGMLRAFGTGELASLRRLDDARPAVAYWRLAARHPVLLRQEPRWRPIVRALALLTPKGAPEERGEFHDPKRKLGEALCDGGAPDWPGSAPRPMLSERRLAQLLAARGEQRTILLTRAVRALATHRDPRRGLDVTDLALAFLRADPGRIAGPYYQRLDRAAVAAATPKDTDDV